MRKIRLKHAVFFISFFSVLFLFSIVSFAADNKCGDNLYWSYSKGTLIISGSGKMYNWNNPGQAPWSEYTESINTVNISNGVTSIGDYAFSGLTNLTVISIPNSLTSIGNNSFEVTGLTTLDIPNSVTSIGDWCFNACSSLTSITIPDSVTFIGGSAFESSGLTSVTIPGGITSINSSVFGFCENLTDVKISEGIKTIDWAAFGNCPNLTSVEIPYSCTSIGESAFISCPSLSYVVLNKSAYNKKAFPGLETSIFHYYYDLTYTSDGHGTIDGKAWAYGTENATFTITPDANYILSKVTITISNKTTELLPDSNGKYIMPESSNKATIKAIFQSVSGTCGENLSYRIVGNTLTISGSGDMHSWDTSQDVPWHGYNEHIYTVVLPSGLSTIGKYAFYGCKSLEYITIPDSVISIDDFAFAECSSLININIPQGITTINNRVFSYCSNLSNIVLPNNVVSIGDYAFTGCKSIVNISIPEKVTSIGNYAFSECKGLTSVTIPDRVTTINPGLFSLCSNLTNVIIPKSVTSIGNSAFYGCSNLISVNIPEGVTSIGSNAFSYCSNLTSINIPKGINIINSWTFSGCSKLTNISIPDGVTSIGNYAFGGCTNLSSIVLPDNLTIIDIHAFEDCKSLISINIPAKVTTIGEWAFYDCSALHDVYYDSTQSDWDDISIGTWNNPLIRAKLHLASYSVSINFGTGGEAILNKYEAPKGEEITVIVTPDSGYEIDKITVNGTEINESHFPMPDEHTEVNVTFKKIEYSVTVGAVSNGEASADKEKACLGDKVTVTVNPAEGYELDEIKVNGNPITGKTFDMPAENVMIAVTFKKIEYTVTVAKTTNGTVTADKEKACVGDTVQITVTPDACYELDTIKVNGEVQTDTSFTMPAGNVTIAVTFKAKPHQLIPVSEEAATCEEDGYEAHYKCTECKKLFSDPEGKNEISAPKVIKKLGHSWDEGEVTKEPTCEEEGVKTFHCTRDGCKATKTEPIPALGHSWDDGEVTKEPTCEEAGVKTFHCTHAGCTETKTEPIPALGHSWDDGEVTKEPTCEEAGVKTFHCTRTGCTETKTEPINALGHNKIVEVAEKAPTKTEPGNIKHYKCERCGKLFSDAKGKNPITKEQTIIPAMGHDLTAVKAKAATCTEPGNTAYYICKDDDCKCGKAYSDPYGQHEINIDDTVIPALGHNPKEVAGKDPTCTEDGYEKYYKCSRCNTLFSDDDGKNEIEKPVVIPKLGHDMKHIEAKKPTHEDDGHKEYYHCNRCGKNFADEDGKTALTDAEIVVPHIGAAVLGEEITDGDFKYRVTNPRTDGTGTVTLIGVENKTETVVIPATVELKLDTYKVNRIGPKAFYNDKTIKSLYIGANVVIIDSSAFYGCSYLVKVYGGKTLQTINASAFAYCSRLKSFSIASPVLKKIGPNTFYKDKKLKTIYIQKTTRLTKAGVKKSLKGSSVKTVKVKKSKVKKYKKYFKKKNSGRKVKVKK